MESDHHRTLEDVLQADPVGSIYAAREKPIKDYMQAHPDGVTLRKRVSKKVRDRTEADPSFLDKIAAIDDATMDGKRQICQLLDITLDEWQQLQEFNAGIDVAARSTPSPDAQALIRSWKTLKERAGIQDVDATNFPSALQRPMLVLYSADWCPPCRAMRPTFAQLVPFFDKADVRYCHDDSLHAKLNPGGIPQFIAYFPNGATVQSFVPGSAREIWETMNSMITLGQSWEGHGTFVCDESSCRIEPRE